MVDRARMAEHLRAPADSARAGDEGRRIYVHDVSFAKLAPAFGAGTMAEALACCRAMRIADHHISSAVDIGLLAGFVADDLLTELAAVLYSSISTLLRAVAIDRDPGCPLLLVDEWIVASCHDSGYWTFATTRGAADRMFADHEPLRELYRKCLDGHGPSDLLMVRGDRLVFVGAEHPAPRASSHGARGEKPWVELLKDARPMAAATARQVLAKRLNLADDSCQRFVSNLVTAIQA